MNDKKLKRFATEKFKEIALDGNLQFRYAISNFGRLISFTDKFEDGRIIRGSLTDGYRVFRYKIREGDKVSYKHKFFYKLVAEYFIPKTSADQDYVLHLNYDRSNDYVSNLKWATRAEMLAHGKKSPHVIEARKKQLAELREKRKQQGNKLTSTQVILLKKKLLDPNRKTRMKILAKQFGVTEMTLYRIKTGENWNHIKV